MGGGCTFTDVNGSSRFLWCVRVLCQPRQLPLSSQNKSNKWSNTIEMECAFVLFCVKRASMYLAMQTIFSLNCSIFTQTRIIWQWQCCLCHGAELQINWLQSQVASPAPGPREEKPRKPNSGLKIIYLWDCSEPLTRFWSLFYATNEVQTEGYPHQNISIVGSTDSMQKGINW